MFWRNPLFPRDPQRAALAQLGEVLELSAPAQVVLLPLLRAGTAKRIICLSTGLAATDVILGSGFTLSPAYAISKAALNMAVAEFAAVLQPEGFTVLAISPGLVNTAEKPRKYSVPVPPRS